MKKIFGALPLLFLFISCPLPFNMDNLSLMQDLSSPVITINTPVQGDAFESSVTVSGSVVDVDGDGTPRSENAGNFIASCTYDILDDDPTETDVTVGDDGSFSFSFTSVSFSSQINLVVTASDINGNEATSSLILVPDENGPFLTISSPEDYSEYATLLILEGSAINSLTDSGTSEVNPVISYTMPGTSISGTTNINTENGTFSSVIDVSALEGNRVIEVTASDLNGNETTAVITITKPVEGGDVSGFTVYPGNKSVTISWDPVPFAESYSLFESEFGTLVEDDVSSPYEWTGLTNGEIYSFQLTAHIPDGSGDDAVSSVVTKMPLSERSLAPSVREIGYRSVEIEWHDYTNISKYIIERSLSPEGPWQVRGSSITDTYTDTSVMYNTEYFYRVRPSEYGDITSDYCNAVPTAFGDQRTDFDVEGTALGIDLVGSYAYLTSSGGSGQLHIIDISDPDNPVERSVCELSVNAYDVVVDGGYAYVTAGANGFASIDVSDPLDPGAPVYSTGTTGYTYSLDVADGYVYLADGDSGLARIDVSNPSEPGAPVYCDTAGRAYGVAVSDGYAYVADNTNGMVVVDLADPTTVYATRSTTAGARGIVVDGDYAYVAAGTSGLAIIDISTPGSPGVPEYSDTAYAQRVAVGGGFAYIADDENKFAVIDVSDPTSPGAVVYRASLSFPQDVALSGAHAFVADADAGLSVYTIAHSIYPDDPVYEDTTGDARGVEIMDSRAYLATTTTVEISKGFAVLDVAEPLDPGTPDYFGTTSSAYNIEVAGSYALFALGNQKMNIIDISNPDSPGEYVYVDTGGYVEDIDVVGPYAYIAANETGLCVIDISDPENPGSPQYKDTTGHARNIVVRGDYAYIATYETGLAIIDISDPESPGDPVYKETNGWAWGVAVYGDYAYVADRGNGLAVIDISDPTSASPGEFGQYDTSETMVNATSVAVAGHWVFVTDSYSGLAIFDASNPSALKGPYYCDTPLTGEPYSITVVGDYAYIADSSSGLAVIRLWEEL